MRFQLTYVNHWMQSQVGWKLKTYSNRVDHLKDRIWANPLGSKFPGEMARQGKIGSPEPG